MKPSESTESGLFAAVWQGRSEIIKKWISEGGDPNAVISMPNGSTLLLEAAAAGRADVAGILLDAGADANRLDSAGMSALCEAASNGSDEAIEVMQLLLKYGADIEGGRPSTPLMSSCPDSLAAMECLLDAGADPNATRPRRGTALRICVEKEEVAAVGLLVARGADPSIVGPILQDGTTAPCALDLATQKDLKEIVAILTRTPFELVNNGRETVLQLLEEASSDETNYYLLPGAPPDLIDEYLSAVGNDVPGLLLEMYRRADGQDSLALLPLLPQTDYHKNRGWYFLPIREALTDWRSMTEALENGAFEAQRNLKSDPGISKAWWHRGWIPFMLDGCGGYVCFDLAPAAGGTVGQVLLFDHDSPVRRLLAKSVESFFSR